MTRLEMIVELRELTGRMARLQDALCNEQRREDETFAKIMDAVRANDEATANMGGLPCSAEVAWNADRCSTHDCATPDPEMRDEPPSVPA